MQISNHAASVAKKSAETEVSLSPPRPPAALLITVNYRCESSTLALIANLSKLKSFSALEMIVVDNESSESSARAIQQAISGIPQVSLIESPSNLGYFRAVEIALRRHLEIREIPDWVIVCNNDVIIEDEDFVNKLFRHDPLAVGVLAPRIQALPKGRDQNPFMAERPSRWRWAGLRLISSSYGFATVWDWVARHKTARGQTRGTEKTKAIYAPHGSFMIFSRRYFEAGGYFDSNLFLFGEEISVAEICRLLNLKILYEPSLRVMHEEHLATGNRLSPLTYQYQRQALQYLSRRYFSSSKSPKESCSGCLQ